MSISSRFWNWWHRPRLIAAMERAVQHPAPHDSAHVNRCKDAHFTTAYADGKRDGEERADHVTLSEVG